MTHRIQVIGDELFGADGEAAALFSELLLCENPSRPLQFAISASVRFSLDSLLARAPSDILGKQAEWVVLGLGLHELKMVADADKAFVPYKALVDDIVSKTSSLLCLLTIPGEALPECASFVEEFNEKLKSLKSARVRVLDFAEYVADYENAQLERGKFARSLYDSSHLPTSLCHVLLGLFIQKNFFKQKESENGF